MNQGSVISEFIKFIVERKAQILSLLWQHIGLTLIAVIVAVIIAVPLGIFITHNKRFASPIIGIANVVQAIPSLAILGFLIPLLGIGSKPAILMVMLYSLLPILKNTYIGITNINPDMIEAAQAMGLTTRERLWKVELPLALPVIMAGIRISAVTAVGLMTIAAFIGAGGLGYLVFTGVSTVNTPMVLAGAIPSAILALLMDFVLGKIENAVVPVGLKIQKGIPVKRKRKTSKKHKKIIASVVAIIVIVVAVFNGVNYLNRDKNTIIIGSKNFNEQSILGNMVSTLIEKNTNIKVERKLNLGGTSITFNALTSKSIDAYVEYTGTAYVSMLKQPSTSDADKTYTYTKDTLQKQYSINVLKPIGFNNTYAIAVRQDTAAKYNLKTISDLAKVSNELTFAPTMEFSEREDGYPGVKKLYGLNFKKVSPMGRRFKIYSNK